jgi:glycosyltransferase involved in cell wall biosynthesis
MPVAQKPRQLHAVHFIVGLQAGGAEIALSRLIGQSSGPELKHTVVSLTDRGDLATAIENAGGAVISLGLNSRPSLLPGLIGAICKLSGLKPDVVQGWMVHGNLVAWVVRLLMYPRARLAWNLRTSLRNAIHESPRTLRLTRLAAHASRSVDLLISNSVSGLEDHIAIGYAPCDVAVIPNGFDPDVFKPDAEERRRIRRSWAVADDVVVYGLIGRYNAAKGHDVFIRAAALVRDNTDIAFALIGRNASPDNPDLAGALQQHGLTDRFHLLGPRNDIPAVLCGLDVVCVPSVYEGFPNALAEAMASGLPCIATDVSDVSRILGDAGRVIAVGDRQALARAMLDLRELGPQGREALGASGRRIILEKYTLRAVAADYRERYRALVAATA